MLVAVAAPAGVVFACGFVVPGAEPGPGGQVGGVREVSGDVGADLGDDRGGGEVADAGDGGQQVTVVAEGRHHRLGLPV